MGGLNGAAGQQNASGFFLMTPLVIELKRLFNGPQSGIETPLGALPLGQCDQIIGLPIVGRMLDQQIGNLPQ